METTRRSLARFATGAAALATLLPLQSAHAQSPPGSGAGSGSGSGSAAMGADQAAIVALIETFRDAYLKLDKAKLEGLVAEQLNYGHSSGTIEDKGQFVAAALARKGVMKSLKFHDVKVDVTGTTAIARHGWESETEVEGKATVTKVGVMQVWQKFDGTWKLYARQAFRLPS